MQRICGSLTSAGYEVWLIGRNIKGCSDLSKQPYGQVRLNCWMTKGPFFYLEFNIRLLFYLLFKKCDLICAIDLDTILACYLASAAKGCHRVYDAHEYFTEQKEIATRSQIKRIWLAIERLTVPKFKWGYTVNQWIADTFKLKYGVSYGIIRNLPLYIPYTGQPAKDPFIIYQGAVNEGRCFEQLIPAMKEVTIPLKIYGTGNFIKQTKSIIYNNSLAYKVELFDPISPSILRIISGQAKIGITLFDDLGLNQVHSLANRFFDYIMAGIPQLCIDFPEYRVINQQWEVAYLISDPNPKTIAAALNKLLDDPVLYNKLRLNCLEARNHLNWNLEEKSLITFYQNIFQSII
jgi:glycosyltransferase involved in cell wall biosynthesis